MNSVALGGNDVVGALQSGSWTLLLMVLGVLAGTMGGKWKQNWLVWLGIVVFLVGAGWLLVVFFAGGAKAP